MLYPRNALACFPRLVCVAAFASALGGCSVFFPSGSSPPPPLQHDLTIHPIRVNTVGYLPSRTKVATVVQAPTESTVEVHSVADDSVVWTGTLAGPTNDNGASPPAPFWIADFSAFDAEGQYYLSVPGVGRSAAFRIASDVYTDAFTRAMLGLYGQRCGTDVTINLDGRTWSHKACHANDAYLTVLTGSETIRPSRRGWHDAGDYGKYTANGAFSVGMLLEAWERFQPKIQAVPLAVPEHGGPIPDFLAEVKWELDWLLTTQLDDGSAVHKVTAKAFEPFIMPEDDGSQRFYVPVGTVATADVVAVMAEAARIYMPYDPDFAATCLAAATKGYAFLAQHETVIVPDQTGFGTGAYPDSTDADDRLWAAAEMWETTGDPAVLADFETRAISVPRVPSAWDWTNTANLGVFTYLLSARPGRAEATVAALTTMVITSADSIVNAAGVAPYGRGITGYITGGNGMVARATMNLWIGYLVNNQDPKYLDAMTLQLDYLLGRNYYDRSQVTGVGSHPPLFPHHRPSAADVLADPWPGLLVGGPTMSESTWQDVVSDSGTNETAINWIAPFVYATAAELPGE